MPDSDATSTMEAHRCDFPDCATAKDLKRCETPDGEVRLCPECRDGAQNIKEVGDV